MSVESTSSAAVYVPPPPPPPLPEQEVATNAKPLMTEEDASRLQPGGGQEQSATVAPETAGTVNGNATTGTRLPSTSTEDGKSINRLQLADGEQANLVRERTMPNPTFGGGNRPTDDQLVLTTKGTGDDKVSVSQNTDGTLAVDVNGEKFSVKLAPGQQFGIRVGDGNDVVTVAPNVKVNFVIDGGAGDDTLTAGAGNDHIDGGVGNDTINGGAGKDDLFGNSGDDHIDGGSGESVIYGGDGDDTLTATGDGKANYFEGGNGNDTIDASRGQNIVSGGRGDDNITSGGSKNTIYAGDGTDTVNGVTAADKVFAQTSVDAISFASGQFDRDQVVMNVLIDPKLGTTGIKVEGSDAFRQRVEADLEMLRSSSAGQKMLGAFDQVANEKGHTLLIKELANELNSFALPTDWRNTQDSDYTINSRGQQAEGVDATVLYNKSIDLDSAVGGFRGFLPSVVLFHEMSHAYNFTHGNMLPGDYSGSGPDNGINNSERQAVGLETTAKPFDFDKDPSTPATTHNPIELTENGLRREFGLDDRPSYAL